MVPIIEKIILKLLTQMRDLIVNAECISDKICNLKE